MTKLLAFNPTTNKTVLRNVDVVNLAEISTDTPLIIPGGRLTLSSTNTVADGTDQTTVYYLPEARRYLPLWNASTSQWVYKAFTSLSLNISANSTVNLPYDFYAYLDGSGNLAFSGYYWASATARSAALLRRDGLYYLDGVQTNDALLLGTAYLTGSAGAARVSDSVTHRLLWNVYNQVSKRVFRLDQGSSWTYSSNIPRPFNNNTANRIQVVDGLGNGILDVTFMARVSPASSNFGVIGMGLDSTSSISDGYTVFVAADSNGAPRCSRTVGLGYHYLQALEATGNNGLVTTFYGANYNGLVGNWSC